MSYENDKFERRRKAHLQCEIDDLQIEARIIAHKLDRAAKELDTLTIEMNVQRMTAEYPAFERELLKMEIL